MLCFSRRKLLPAAVIVLVIAVGAVLLLSRGRGKGAERVYPGGNEGRVAYLEKLGWQVEPQPIETLDLQLPETLEKHLVDAGFGSIRLFTDGPQHNQGRLFFTAECVKE